MNGNCVANVMGCRRASVRTTPSCIAACVMTNTRSGSKRLTAGGRRCSGGTDRWVEPQRSPTSLTGISDGDNFLSFRDTPLLGLGALRASCSLSALAILSSAVPSHTERLSADTAYIDSVLADGAVRAEQLAADTMGSVKDIIGFIRH